MIFNLFKVSLKPCRLLLLATQLFCAFTFASKKTPWPFDQRQILLVKSSASQFPDDLTAAQIMDVFVRRGRIRWVTQGAPTQLNPLEVPKDFAWYSAPAVRKLGLKYKTDGIVHLSTDGAEIDLKWYATIDGLPLFFETLKVPNAGDDPEWQSIRKKRIQDWINGIWNRIPGDGFVVERAGSTLTIEGAQQLGAESGMKIDTLRILGIKRHPVLKTLIDFEQSETGFAEITKVDESDSIAEVVFEAEIDPIQTGDRYRLRSDSSKEDMQLPPASLKPQKQKDPKAPDVKPGKAKRVSFFGNTKKMIDLSAAIAIGPVKHTEAFSASNTYELKTSAFNPGIELDALLYFTRAWIMGVNFSSSFGSFKTVDSAYSVDTVNTGVTSYLVYGGYRFLFLKELASPAELRLMLGYRSWGLSMESLGTAIAPSAKNYSGLDMGILVGFPLYSRAGAYIHGGRMFAASVSEKPSTSGAGALSSFWRFGGAVTYNLNVKNQVKVGMNFESASTSFDGSGQRTTSSLSTKITRKYLLLGYSYSY